MSQLRVLVLVNPNASRAQDVLDALPDWFAARAVSTHIATDSEESLRQALAEHGPTADRIVIELGYAADQQNVSESVSCVALNDGEFTVDGSLFQQTWSYEALIFTRVSAVREGGSTVPLNNGESRVTAAHTVFGILFTNAD